MVRRIMVDVGVLLGLGATALAFVAASQGASAPRAAAIAVDRVRMVEEKQIRQTSDRPSPDPGEAKDAAPRPEDREEQR